MCLLYGCAARVESMACFSTSLNGCVVVVWFINMNCASALTENKPTTSLQACTPSNHVYSVFELSAVPQFLNQAPPGAQQLILPDFLMVPHLEHMKPIVVTVAVVAAGVRMWILGQRKPRVNCISHRAYLCRPAGLRSTCAQRLRYCHFHTS